MLNYLKRRKRLFISTAVGVAGAAAAYYLWGQDDEPSCDQSTWCSRQDQCCGDEQAVIDQDQAEQGMDGSLTSHFQYIQGEAAPDQLELLMPRLQAMLYKMTDVQASLAALPPDSSVHVKLQVMAQHSLARPLAAAWLLPLVDLLVRAKLNFIGRHVFLEEKLSKLRQPTPQQTLRMRAAGNAGNVVPRLPPRIQGNAIEAFLLCTYMETVGGPWLVQQVLEVVSAHLANMDLESARSPDELAQLLDSLHANVKEALTQSLTSWAELLLGDTAAPGPYHARDTRPLSSGTQGPPPMPCQPPSPLLQDPQVAAVEAELQRDLRAALCTDTFAEAVDAAVQHTLRTMQTHVLHCFPASPLPVLTPSERGSSEGGEAMSSQSSMAGTPPAQQQPAPLQDGSGTRGWLDLLGAVPVLSLASSVCGTATRMALSPVSWALTRPFSMGAAMSATTGAPISHTSTRAHSLHEAVSSKPARPLARLLKPTQSACDPLFIHAHDLSKATANLGPVLAFCASIFAKPINSAGSEYIGF